MGKTTAGLPLRAGEHYEKCPADGTVYRTRRRTRFRCPGAGCHALAYPVPTPEGEPGHRRSLDGDDQARIFRILDERPAADAPPPVFGDDVIVYLEDAEAAPAPGIKPTRSRPGVPARRTAAAIEAERQRDRGPAPRSIVGRLWHGSLGDIVRRG